MLYHAAKLDRQSTADSHHGSKEIDDILFVSFGEDYLNNLLKENEDNSEFIEKYMIIQKYITPIKYKIISWSMQNRNNIEKKK